MDDRWISEASAIARATMVGIPDAANVLADAIDRGEVETRGFKPPTVAKDDIFQDAVSLYAGGITYVDFKGEISLASLMAWIADMRGEVSKKPGREPGTGYNDAAMLAEMRRLLETGEASSVNAAAHIVAPGAKGGGNEGSRADRLRHKFKAGE